MAEAAPDLSWPNDPIGGVLFRIAKLLAIFGGLLGCAMAVIVTVSVSGRYLFGWPVPGDYDIVGILSGCAIFAFLPYCQLLRGNVLVDFFTARAPPRLKAVFDAVGTTLYLAIAVLFAWRLCYGAIDLRQSSEVIAAFNFYRWWTLPFDIFCMLILIAVIVYTLVTDIGAVRTGRPARRLVVHGD
jgi:TRAP-type C4-dicarboxylate transport system permease small subunit